VQGAVFLLAGDREQCQRGSLLHDLKNFIPAFDATVVSKLRSAGAVVLGKLNLSEGAAAGYNPSFDVPVNPWRADRWPGMSSSGSGVATAAGLCFASIGTDTGGSIAGRPRHSKTQSKFWRAWVPALSK
jgi:Asp-tRNA(Asn)/Glu-tRNA(Gln) amidotransferase A subunit family amidase